MDEVFEFLENKNMSRDYINVIYNWYYKQKKDFDFVSRLNSVYNLFYYANLNNDQIKKMLVNSLDILKMNASEMFKLAFVLKFCPYTDVMFELNDKNLLQSLSNYKRIFVRTLIFNEIKKWPSASSLLCNENQAYGVKYKINRLVFSLFNVNASTDKELESLLSGRLMINGVPKTVNEFLEEASYDFRRQYINSLKKGHKK